MGVTDTSEKGLESIIVREAANRLPTKAAVTIVEVEGLAD